MLSTNLQHNCGTVLIGYIFYELWKKMRSIGLNRILIENFPNLVNSNQEEVD